MSAYMHLSPLEKFQAALIDLSNWWAVMPILVTATSSIHPPEDNGQLERCL